jgi:DNA-binding transcriptional LysR family regulator
MDIRQIKTFVEVSKLRSFSKAAETLFLTQPTVSNHIQALEKEFDTILINRLSKGLTLTVAGEIFYLTAVDILNTYETAKFELDNYKGKIEGHLEISASSVPRKHLLPQLIDKFLRINPGVTFAVKDMDSKEVVDRILRGEIDFGFVGAQYEARNLIYIPVMDDELMMIVPLSMLAEYKDFDSVSIEEILNLPFIFREEGSGTLESLKLAMEQKGLSIGGLKTVAWIEDSEAIKKMVSIGTGCSFISVKDVGSKDDGIRNGYKILRIVELDLKRQFYLVYHKSRQLSPLGDNFKSLIINSL